MTASANHPIFGSTRMAIAIVGFLGFINLYALRINMSSAMVCMNDQFIRVPASSARFDNRTIRPTQSLKQLSECNTTDDFVLELREGEFNWSKQVQGYILGSFFWGYLITQIPGGWLAHRFGGKRVLGWSMFVCAVCTVLMPVGARLHYSLLMILRIIAGLCQGVAFPAMHCIWSRWSPPMERSTLLGLTFSGTQLGNVLSLSVSGYLCEYGFDGGWSNIFYLFGGLGIVWFAAWMYIVYDSPREHPRVSNHERMYIEKSLENQVSHEKDQKIPWKAIFTSLPVWAIVVTHMCANWGTYTFLTNIPTFLAEVLQLDLKSNGLISSIPYWGFWLFITLSGFVADFLLRRNVVQLTGARKIFNSIGLLGPALFVVLLSFVGCGQIVLAIVLLVLGVAFSGFQYSSGFVVNHADIAPNYSGLLFGITNTFATIPGFAAPAMIGAITKNKLRSEWQIVFYISAVIYCVGALFYALGGSGKIQHWAVSEEQRKADKEITYETKI